MVNLPKCSDNVITIMLMKFIKFASKIMNTTKQSKDRDKDKNNGNVNEITLTNATNTATLHHQANQKPTTPTIPHLHKTHIP